MSESAPVLTRLREADRALQGQRLPPKSVRRIRRRMARELRRADKAAWRWLPMATFVAGAALVLLVFATGRRPQQAAEPQFAPAVAVNEAPRPVGPDCRWNDHDGLELHGVCEVALHDPPMHVHTMGDTRLSVRGHRAVLDRGGALFDVAPLDEPFVVRVPGGSITVIGTRFRITLGDAGGRVELLSGVIRFEDDEGVATRMQAGDVLDFGEGPPRPATDAAVDDEAETPPDAATVEPEADHAAPKPKPKPKPKHREPTRTDADATRLVEEVAALRARGRYLTAVERLRDALDQRWSPRTIEVLSFELGTILTRHLGDTDAACRHWAEHLRRFDSGRYRRAIEQARAKLRCTERPGPRQPTR